MFPPTPARRVDRYAEMAAKMIYEALPVVREEPKNVEMREQLLVASFLAGMAFTRTYVGYVHAFAHSIGGRYGVAHGLANAVLLPHIMEYYLPVSHAPPGPHGANLRHQQRPPMKAPVPAPLWRALPR